ncbi:hypothetical protein JCM19314_2970 [Nonlabens ulvanivorans]|uniref:Uncharacterized protein n=1 Tax=Nonlabens ulvanivorans TaxID=906888 RepID=A0A090Q784_NONUL|nr:hypothetical protein [Nonlabens ulvanivorans]GAK98939.1 hypothetical protein JCM19314_2970 [Nonlabens ulvanivorans]
MKYTAVIIGATGLTGSRLVNLLFDNAQYERVITLSRSVLNSTTANMNHISWTYLIRLFILIF